MQGGSVPWRDPQKVLGGQAQQESSVPTQMSGALGNLAGLRQHGAGGGMGEASRRRLEFGREAVLTGSKRSP